MRYKIALLSVLALFFSSVLANAFAEDNMAGDGDSKAQAQSENRTLQEQNPNDLPAHWRLSYLLEPVFNSQILVAEIGDNSKPSVLLVHGLGKNGLKDWLSVIPALENNYHIITLDLPGFGYSEVPKGRYSPSNYAKILHWLKQRLGKQPLIVVGHSMGGAVGLRYAYDYPADVKRLIMVDAAGILTRTAFIKNRVAISAQDADSSPAALQVFMHGFNYVASSIVERISQGPDPSTLLFDNLGLWDAVLGEHPNGNAALALIDEDFSPVLANMRLPTWLIWGENDLIAPLRTGKLLAQQLNNAQLFTIKGAGHVPMKSHSDRFNQILLSALTALAPKPRLLTPAQESQGNVLCHNQSGLEFQGRYDQITINNCKQINLINVTAQSLLVNHSVVNIENLTLESKTRAMVVNGSVIIATNAMISGNTAITASGSRLDFAGVTVRGKMTGIVLRRGCRMVFSISQLFSPYYSGFLHGDYVLKNSILDKKVIIKVTIQRHLLKK